MSTTDLFVSHVHTLNVFIHNKTNEPLKNPLKSIQENMVVVTQSDAHAAFAFFLLLTLATVLMVCVICRKRKTEGTYRPSAEERKQAQSQETDKPGFTLPLPKEERLI